jgi:hypothetical protein
MRSSEIFFSPPRIISPSSSMALTSARHLRHGHAMGKGRMAGFSGVRSNSSHCIEDKTIFRRVSWSLPGKPTKNAFRPQPRCVTRPKPDSPKEKIHVEQTESRCRHGRGTGHWQGDLRGLCRAGGARAHHRPAAEQRLRGGHRRRRGAARLCGPGHRGSRQGRLSDQQRLPVTGRAQDLLF